MRRFLTILFLVCTMAVTAMAGDRVFFVSRNLNRNNIGYDICLKNGKLNLDEPLKSYWYKSTDASIPYWETTFIQRKMAYGYSVEKKGNNEVTIKLKACNKRLVRICQRNGKWVALATIAGKECVLTEIYAHCPSRTSCDYIIVRGKTVAGGVAVEERMSAK